MPPLPEARESRAPRRNAAPSHASVWQWRGIVLLGVAVLILGLVGFWKYFSMHREPRSLWHVIYVTLQLFTLESGPVRPPVPWQLNLARFLAPVVPAWAAVKALLVIFGDQFQTLRTRRMRGHVVVCGLGRKGLQLVRDFRAHGGRVVVVERDAENDAVPVCQELGVPVVIGDATDMELLRRVGVQRAQHVVAVCGEDGTNVNIAVLVYRLVRERSPKIDGVVRCSVQVIDLRLSTLLERHRIVTESRDRFCASVFNPYQSSARLLLADYPLDYERIESDDPRSAHLVIVGFGQMGESVALQAARIGCFANGKKLRVTVVDLEARTLDRRFRARHPQVDELCVLSFVEGNAEDPEILKNILRWAEDPDTLTTVAICLDDDSRGLSCALGVLSMLKDRATPLLVRMADEVGLATLLECEGEQCGWVVRVHAFGVLSRVCSREALLRERLDTLARSIHQTFIERRGAEGRPVTDPSMSDWDRLDEALKNSNRQVADHIPVKLRAIGCNASSDEAGVPAVTKFEAAEIELVARMEHARWCAERLLGGWTPGETDVGKRTTPYLVDYDALPEDVQEYDRESVQAIPRVLELVGERVYRTRSD